MPAEQRGPTIPALKPESGGPTPISGAAWLLQAAVLASFPRLRGARSLVRSRPMAPTNANIINDIESFTPPLGKAPLDTGLPLGCQRQRFSLLPVVVKRLSPPALTGSLMQISIFACSCDTTLLPFKVETLNRHSSLRTTRSFLLGSQAQPTNREG